MAENLIHLLPILVLPSLLVFSSPHTLHLWRATSGVKSFLPFSPTLLSATDIALLIGLIIFKTLLSTLGIVPPLQPSPKEASTFDLPPLQLTAPLHVSKTEADRYIHAARLPLNSSHAAKQGGDLGSNPTPNDSPLLLAPALSTPLMLILLANRSCPIKPLGAVNVRNRFEFLAPKACADLTAVRDISATARMGGADRQGRRVKRGVEFDVVVEVSGRWGGDERGDGQERGVLFRQYVTLLQQLPRRAKPVFVEKGGTEATEKEGKPRAMQTLGEVRFSEQAPSSWAAVCCDYNPIHMSKVAARLFGFGGRIAHGNHVAAAVMELLKDESVTESLGSAETMSVLKGEKAWWLEVAFRRPMVLPLKMEVKGSRGEDGVVSWETARASDTKVYVEGSIGLLGRK